MSNECLHMRCHCDFKNWFLLLFFCPWLVKPLGRKCTFVLFEVWYYSLVLWLRAAHLDRVRVMCNGTITKVQPRRLQGVYLYKRVNKATQGDRLSATFAELEKKVQVASWILQNSYTSRHSMLCHHEVMPPERLHNKTDVSCIFPSECFIIFFTCIGGAR